MRLARWVCMQPYMVRNMTWQQSFLGSRSSGSGELLVKTGSERILVAANRKQNYVCAGAGCSKRWQRG